MAKLPPRFVKPAAAHVRRLTELAVHCEDEDRRLDAVRTLGLLALLLLPDDPLPGAECPEEREARVILLEAFRRGRAA